MFKKIIILITCLMVSPFALANTKNVPVQFENSYPVSSSQPNRIVYFSPEEAAAGLWTFNVNKARQLHNFGLQSDTLTVVCNGTIILIKAGLTGTCKLTHGQVGTLFIADADFLNGNDGDMTYTDLVN